MNKKTIWILIVVIILVFGLINYSKKSQQSGDTIKVAALLSLTGDAATWGQNAQRAIELAVEEVNRNGGINGKQIEVLYEDTAGDPKKAVSAYQLSTSVERVTAILGPLLQTEVSAIAPLIDKSRTPTIAPAYIPLQNRTDLSNPLFVWTDAETEAGRMAQYVFDQGIKTIGVVGTLDSWETTVSNAFAAKFKTLGGTVTGIEIVQSDSNDMKLPITKIINTKPQAVFIGSYYQFVNSTKSLRDLGYKGKLFSIEVDDYLAGETAGWVSNLQFIAPDYYNIAFKEKFMNKFGSVPGLPAGQSYDAANILFSFLEKSENQKDLLQYMKEFKEYSGVSVKLKIDAEGRTYLPMALFNLSKGVVSRVLLLE